MDLSNPTVVTFPAVEAWEGFLASVDATGKEMEWNPLGDIAFNRLREVLNSFHVCANCGSNFSDGMSLGRMMCHFEYNKLRLKCDHSSYPRVHYPGETRVLALRCLYMCETKPPLGAVIEAVLYFDNESDMADPDYSYILFRTSQPVVGYANEAVLL